MTVIDQINSYLQTQPEPKRSDLLSLHDVIMQLLPEKKLWFLDGKNSDGKVVSNPNIGYGVYNIQYKNGSNQEFYQIGLSGNTAGISVYIMGIKNKKYLFDNFDKIIGKASITSYCIKFKSLNDINIEILKKAITYGIDASSED